MITLYRALFGLSGLTLIACSGENAKESVTTAQEKAATENTVVTATSTKSLPRIGLQLYTLRTEMEGDFEGTLRRVAALGYHEVEFAGLFGRDAAEVKVLLDEIGLAAPAAHANWKRLREDPANAIAEIKALGAEYIILAYMPEEERQTLAQWEEWIALMNKVGSMAQAEGLTFAYHNHEFEFVPIDGVVPYDLILAKTDPELVKMELDLFWVALAGIDSEAYVKAHPGRFVLSHVKDMGAIDQKIVDVGRGQIDFGAIFAVAEPLGMKHFFVEHDNSEAPFATIEYSINTLRELTY